MATYPEETLVYAVRMVEAITEVCALAEIAPKAAFEASIKLHEVAKRETGVDADFIIRVASYLEAKSREE